MHTWLQQERARVHESSATAKALNYRLNAWDALMRNLLDGEVNVA
ncbi:IS66 family transposase [Variovorax boronicumulans]